MIHGTAKIVTNEGSGKYTITQQFLDTDSGTYKDGTVGLVAVDAWDINLDANRATGDMVIFQIQESYDGKLIPIIQGPGLGGGGGSGPMRLDKEYAIEGNVAWTTIDTRDWRGRWIWVNMVDGDVDLDEFADDDVEIWDSIAVDYAKQSTQPHAWFKTLLYTSPATEQAIIRDIFSPLVLNSGNFYLRMKTNGNLEIMVENWTAIFSLRFSIISTAAKSTREVIG